MSETIQIEKTEWSGQRRVTIASVVYVGTSKVWYCGNSQVNDEKLNDELYVLWLKDGAFNG